MRFIIACLFCLTCFSSLSKDKKVLTLDYHQTNFISFEGDVGPRFGKTSINTGFIANNGSRVSYYPGYGIQGKLSFNYFNGLRWTYGVTYSIQSGSLNKEYENGSGVNIVEVVTPIVRFAPLLFHNNTCKINIGIGLDAVISNSLEVNAKIPEEVHAVYDFKKSFMPTLMIEYQAILGKHTGMRFGVSGHKLKNELSSFKFNNQTYDPSVAPSGMINHTVFNSDIYIGVFVFL